MAREMAVPDRTRLTAPRNVSEGIRDEGLGICYPECGLQPTHLTGGD